MKKVIAGKVYDTETAEIVKKVTFGAFGDKDGYEETLYVTPEGLYFVYENGGEESLYPEEAIKRISKAKANEWLEQH